MENLLKKNPGLALYTIHDAEFARYGKIRTDIDAQELIAEAKKIPMPEEGSAYVPSVEAFEALPAAGQIKDCLFGGLATQVGYCYGHSSLLNALEWHIGSELNVASTPFVLFLARQEDLVGNKLCSSVIKAFYVPEGAVVEIFEGTLHFCPCETSENGFGCVVGLLEGTNIPHQQPVPDKVLFKKNKWLIAHNENTALIEKGIVPGISGENLQLKY